MLQKSFSHIPSIGATTEKKIWASGIDSMDDFVKLPPEFLSKNKCSKIMEHIKISKEKISAGDACYFYENLSTNEHWRLFKEFQDSTVYF
ncbi:hypothetical protein [sulfur-oxidizing endosymbiont of Gigantopelta aegis]|uniref:hypothetical protein n=1 Tax=sulfur-oxidizing endosymbiont of Gigantopelta aegis TaxID=2794934 RepID=UPI0018DE8748|nr:hypothetical protein [sulfur-oxidizing endosymbiont of Gigantopelta aegis]